MALFYNDSELGVAYATVAMATAVAGVLGGPIAAALLSLDGLFRQHTVLCVPMHRKPPTACLAKTSDTDMLHTKPAGGPSP